MPKMNPKSGASAIPPLSPGVFLKARLFKLLTVKRFLKRPEDQKREKAGKVGGGCASNGATPGWSNNG
jgi:hypothetical protein